MMEAIIMIIGFAGIIYLIFLSNRKNEEAELQERIIRKYSSKYSSLTRKGATDDDAIKTIVKDKIEMNKVSETRKWFIEYERQKCKEQKERDYQIDGYLDLFFGVFEGEYLAEADIISSIATYSSKTREVSKYILEQWENLKMVSFDKNKNKYENKLWIRAFSCENGERAVNYWEIIKERKAGISNTYKTTKTYLQVLF